MFDNLPDSKPFGRNICHICGGHDFVWGETRVYNGRVIAFHEGYSDPGSIPSSRAEPLHARRCSNCGNVQWFVAQDKEK